MKVAFIHAPFQVEPLGIGYLASILRIHGHQARLFRADLVKKVDVIYADVLAYSVLTGSHDYYAKLNREIKGRHHVSVFGGPHPTYFPQYIKEDGIDFIVQGEGERSLPILMHEIEDYGAHYSRVIPPAPLIQDLDSIPLPDRSFLYTYRENFENPIKNIMTSRGCPYSCPYCFNSMYRKMYEGQRWTRFRKPSRVILEAVLLKGRYPLEMIYFQDDEFILNPYLKELMEGYSRYVSVPFHCQLRIEHLTEEKAKWLKRGGCYSVTFAVESGDWEIRSGILQRHIKDRAIKRGALILQKYGIKYRIENMVGIPTEPLRKMIKTVRLNAKLKPTIGWCSIFQPYPNLPLSEKAKDLGLWDGKLNMESSFFETTILKTEHKLEIENLQKLFSLFVLFNVPSWIIRILIKQKLNWLYKWISKTLKERLYMKLYGTHEAKKKKLKCLLIFVLVLFCNSPQTKAEDYTVIDNGNSSYIYNSSGEHVGTATRSGQATYLNLGGANEKAVLSLE